MIASSGLTTGGWVVMLLSVGGVTFLFGWCLYRVLSGPRQHDATLHGMNIPPPDTNPPREGR